MQFPDCVNGPALLTKNLVCNTSATPAARAKAIVAAMNITEKIANMVDNALGSARLGLPPYEWWSEALHGVAGSPGVSFSSSGNFSYATSFANPILLAAAFDDELIERIGEVISTEARAFSNVGKAGLDFWTPNINPYKDPRWGRGMETPGEDPFRIQSYVKNLLLGLEGDQSQPFKKVVATCKHYAAYDLENWEGVTRYAFNANVSMQDMVEYYLPPFQQCARDSRVGSVMCSYNAVNGVPTCASKYLLQTVLREHWNWTDENQYVVSDCNAIHSIMGSHNYTATLAEAAGISFTAGTDNVCEASNQPTDTAGAYNQSLVTEAVLSQALERQYEALVRLGYFDPAAANPYRTISWNNVSTPNAQDLARQSAVEAIVLLKNDGTLPLALKNGTKVAMIGIWANAQRQMQGGYSGIPPYLHSPVYAAQQLGLQVAYANGPINDNTKTVNMTSDALAAANASDIVFYFGGIDSSIEGEAMDRYSVAWSPAQLDLISQVSSLGKPSIVIKMGGQLDDTPLLTNKNISAILWAGYPGQDGGPAVFDILTGKYAPAGRLPVTQYPAKYTDQVPMTDMSLRPSATNPGRTYKFYNNSVLPFGYGLHYTNFTAKFAASTFKAPHSERLNSPRTIEIDNLLYGCFETFPDLCHFPSDSSIEVEVTNTGSRTSDFVALVFASGEYGPKPYPIKELVGYKRVKGVEKGETRSLEVDIKVGSLARVDEMGNTVLYPGNYTLLLDVPTQARVDFVLTGEETVLDRWPQPVNGSYA
ncbi:glycoside hydrolase family 3 protein [Stipitochalara longipes BDJ]|nr:glycoside hydrolase family 3 protein [Stipitochalara longipes BDJ]